MMIHISKNFLLTLGGIGLVGVGALGMYGINKFSTPEVVSAVTMTPSAHATQPPVPAPVSEPKVIVSQPQPTIEAHPIPAVIPEPLPRPGYVFAEVIKVRPHYVTKTIPYRSCHMEPRTMYVNNGPSGAGTVIGGVAGGVIGNQFGGGKGKVATTIGGAILGAVMGNQVEAGMTPPQANTYYQSVCTTEYAHKKVQKGYEVTYLYHGQKNKIIAKHRPMDEMIEIPIGMIDDEM